MEVEVISEVYIQPSQGQHVILLYDTESSRDLAAINYMNFGLAKNYLCVYASVNANNTVLPSKLCFKIKDYKENINKVNLIVTNLKPFYEAALSGDLMPFEKFKLDLQQKLRNSGKNGALVVADCADTLLRNQHFDQCNKVEKWWQDTYMQFREQWQHEHMSLTIICPHSKSHLQRPHFEKYEYQIATNHTFTLDITEKARLNLSPKRNTELAGAGKVLPHIIVVEPERDLGQVYDIWLRSWGFKNIIITDSGKRCLDALDTITEANDKGNNEIDVIIILDTHIEDIPCIQIARQIVSRRSDQHIILTTTLPSTTVRRDISSIGHPSNIEILAKPFRFSTLFTMITQRNS